MQRHRECRRQRDGRLAKLRWHPIPMCRVSACSGQSSRSSMQTCKCLCFMLWSITVQVDINMSLDIEWSAFTNSTLCIYDNLLSYLGARCAEDSFHHISCCFRLFQRFYVKLSPYVWILFVLGGKCSYIIHKTMNYTALEFSSRPFATPFDLKIFHRVRIRLRLQSKVRASIASDSDSASDSTPLL